MDTKGVENIGFPENETPHPLHLTEPPINWNMDDGLINAVITAAVWSVERKPGVWSRMLEALDRGARKAKEDTLEAFFFHAMVNRLLEEYRQLDTK